MSSVSPPSGPGSIGPTQGQPSSGQPQPFQSGGPRSLSDLMKSDPDFQKKFMEGLLLSLSNQIKSDDAYHKQQADFRKQENPDLYSNQ